MSPSSGDGRTFEMGRPNDANNLIDDEELSDNDEDNEDKENIILESPLVWHKFALLCNLNNEITKLLERHSVSPVSDCEQFCNLITGHFPLWTQSIECENDLKSFAYQCRRQLKFVSAIPNFTPRDYGRGKDLFFVHVGFDKYFLAESSHDPTALNIPEYFGFLGDKPTHVPISVESDGINDNKRNFMRIMKIVEGKMKPDKFQESREEEKTWHEKRPYYDPLSKEDLSNKRTFIYKCKLHLEDSFSGYGTIIEERSLDRKIYLHNRRNCFQSFNGDIVNILVFPNKSHTKSNTKKPSSQMIENEIWSGRVISVEESEVKPVNKIFLCKISFGQANFMVPICNTIPNIEVDNDDAKELVKRECGNLIEGLKDVSGIENLIQSRVKPDQCKKFADKCFVTLKFLDTNLKTTFDRIHYVDCFRCEFIFLVIYREWDINRRFPFGEVVGLYIPDASFTKTLPLIAVSCDLSVVSIAEEGKLNLEISKIETESESSRLREKENHSKNSNKNVFSLKYKNQPFNEVAYSYEPLEDEHFKLGMHVVNVEKYIKHGDFLDKIAIKQFFTFLLPVYDSASDVKPFYLFSEKLTNEILSIKTNRTIEVISIYFLVNKDNFAIDNNPTIIFEHLKLDEEVDVEQFDENKEIKPYLAFIYKACFKNRIDRIKSHHISHSWLYPDFSFKMNMSSYLVSEEMEIITNKFIGDLLSRSIANFPVNVNENVDYDKNLQDWMKIVDANCNRHFFPTLNKWFNCPASVNNKTPIRFSEQFLKKIIHNDKINLLKCDMLFPDVSFYFYQLENIVSLNSVMSRRDAGDSVYTVSITKPLSSFNDLLIQRLLVSHQENNRSVYSDDDIDNICVMYKNKKMVLEKYWTICRGYEIKDKFKDVSFILDCVFLDVTEDSILFQHPFLRDVYHSNFILFECLGLSEVKLPSHNQIDFPELEWETKIFINGHVSGNEYLDVPFKLHDIYTCEVIPWRNKLMSSGINTGDKVQLHELQSKSKYASNMTSETSRNMDPKLKLILELKKRQILRIQFSYDYSIGIMKIIPELLIINPHLRLCLCHRHDPFKYFIHPNQLAKINYQRFLDLQEYKEQFRILNRIEGIYQTIRERSSYFIHDVQIFWIGTIEPSNTSQLNDIYGVIILEPSWCLERFIKLGHKNLRIQDPVNTLKKAVEYSQMEFLACIQSFFAKEKVYWMGHAQVSDVAYIGDKKKKLVHLTIKLTHSNFPIKPKLGQPYSLEIMETPITARILDRSLRKLKPESFVETIVMNRIPRAESHDRVFLDYDSEIKISMTSPYQLNEAQYKALQIAINRKFSLIWGPPGTGKTMVGCIIAFAFTLINRRSASDGKPTVLYCGPSNQSVNVVAEKLMKTFGENCPKLVRIFSSDVVNVDFPYPSATVNNDTSSTPDMLKSIALHHIVRQDVKPYADKFRTYSEYFQNNKFRGSVHRLEYSKMVTEYQNESDEAYKTEIKEGQYEIVLCTTVGSCRKFVDEFNISQVIVDEAGMCSEPEIIGPMLTRKNLTNTIFIGDHMQLRPIVTSMAAKGKQFDKSLFERIYDPTRDFCTMLDTQYRMHPSICEFPSKHFYNEENARLITALSESWSGVPADQLTDPNEFNGLECFVNKPHYEKYMNMNNVNIAKLIWKGIRRNDFQCYPFNLHFDVPIQEKILFINVEGYESNQAVTGSTGHVKSKGNKEEVMAVVRLYKKLIQNIKNKKKAPQLILVITQYRLQEHLLKTALTETLKQLKIDGPPNVSTVVKSQGSECDYVIFSTVRSLPNKKDIDMKPSPGWIQKYLGCITDKNEFNVAITRAKKGLFILGNISLLAVNHNWKNLIDDLRDRECIAENIFDVV